MAIELVSKPAGKGKRGPGRPPAMDKQLLGVPAVIGLYDRWSDYPSKGLTPEKVAQIVLEADQGNAFHQGELFEEMMEKGGHLFSLFQTRRLKVESRSYNIIPGSSEPADIKIAEEVSDMFKRIRGYHHSVGEFLDAVPYGYSLNQINWVVRGSRYEIDSFRHIHPKRARFGKLSDPNSDPEEYRILIEPQNLNKFEPFVPQEEIQNALTNGIWIDSDPIFRQRFLVVTSHARTGHPARTSLLRTLLFPYLFSNYNWKWWVQFAERMLGIILGKYDTNEPDQKEFLEQALRKLAYDSTAVVSKDTVIEFAEWAQKAQSSEVYDKLKDAVEGEMSEIVLGHTSASRSTPGRLGNEEGAREVKQELIEADATSLDECITDQVVVPFVNLNFGPQENYPYYETDISQSPNLLDEITLDQGIQKMGFPVTKKYVSEKYSRPLPNPDDPEDEVLVPLALPASGVQNQQQPVAGKDRFIFGNKKKILRRR